MVSSNSNSTSTSSSSTSSSSSSSSSNSNSNSSRIHKGQVGQQENKTRKSKRKQKQNNNHSYLNRLVFCLFSPIKFLLSSLLTHTLASLSAAILLFSLLYLITSSLNSYLITLSTTTILPILTRSISTLTTPILYIYCNRLHGPFCPNGQDEASKESQIAKIARTVSGTAQKAADIFDSVVQLSDPSNLGLYQAEILELAFAIRWSSDLSDKELLSNGLAELAELSRDLKDKLVDLNGQGLNTFSFIAFEFSRLGDLMHWVQTGEKKYTSKTIEKNLDILFNHLSTELNQLLNAIESLIPLASRSTNLGIQVSERLHQEHYQLVTQKTRQGLWTKLLDLTTFSGQQLNKDLSLTSESIKNLKSTWIKLEEIRTDLLTYRNNVAHFKASFTGWHLADHQLTPEDELFSMREIIQRFQLTIKEVKSSSRLPLSSSSSSKARTLSETNTQTQSKAY